MPEPQCSSEAGRRGPVETVRSARAWRSAGRPMLAAAGIVLAGAALRWAPLGIQPGAVERLAGKGVAGEAVFVLLAAAACSVGLPRQAAAFGGGYAFGSALGAGLALIAQMLGCVVDFSWARLLARDWVTRRMGRRLARFDSFLAAHPFRSVLILRLLPIGNNLALNLLAGLSRIRPAPFLLASVLGYVPQTLVFALLGGGVRVTGYLQAAIGAALFAVSLALGVVLLRSARAAISAGQ